MTLKFFLLAEGLSESREAHDASLISLRSLGGKKLNKKLVLHNIWIVVRKRLAFDKEKTPAAYGNYPRGGHAASELRGLSSGWQGARRVALQTVTVRLMRGIVQA